MNRTVLGCACSLAVTVLWGCSGSSQVTSGTGGATGVASSTGGRQGGDAGDASSGGRSVGATGGGPMATGGASPVATGGRTGVAGSTATAPDGGVQADAATAAMGGRGGGVASDPASEGDGDFTIGPTYARSPDLVAKAAPVGRAFDFTMSSQMSQSFTGLDTTLLPANQHSFTRAVRVYVPARYQAGSPAPFIVLNDGTSSYNNIKVALDNLSQETNPARRLPPFVIIAVANGGGDSKGSERGLEYDTMSERFARFVQMEVLPAVLANAAIKAAYPTLTFTANPDGRAVMGCSSGGAAALTMGWFRPDLFGRIITYSGTFVDQQDDDAPEEVMYPLGAWEYHSDLSLIASAERKPLRIFVNANQMDNGATAPESGHHNWLLANQRTAMALKAKNYHYRFVYGLGAGHCDGKVQDATMADTLLWAWRGYPAP
jgi:enterochelin esterase family protein